MRSNTKTWIVRKMHENVEEKENSLNTKNGNENIIIIKATVLAIIRKIK